jgi:hypothetical protein
MLLFIYVIFFLLKYSFRYPPKACDTAIFQVWNLAIYMNECNSNYRQIPVCDWPTDIIRTLFDQKKIRTVFL